MPSLGLSFACCAGPPVSRHRCVPRSPKPSFCESSFAELRLVHLIPAFRWELYLACPSFCDMLFHRSAGILLLCHRALGSVPSGGFPSSWVGVGGWAVERVHLVPCRPGFASSDPELCALGQVREHSSGPISEVAHHSSLVGWSYK